MKAQIKYHNKTFHHLGLNPKLSKPAIKILEKKEKEKGFVLPPAVKEWYSIEGSFNILKEYSRCDDPLSIEKFGEPYEDWVGVLPDDLIENGILIIMYENQGVCSWAVALNNQDDPPVYIKIKASQGMIWNVYSEHFSDFIFSQIWDNDYSQYEIFFTANDVLLNQNDLELLKKNFFEEIKTYGWPGQTNYRFNDNNNKILIWNRDDQSDWFIATKSKETLVNLLKIIFMCGTLEKTLGLFDDYDREILEEAKDKLKNPTK